jgi:hypothetical protein
MWRRVVSGARLLPVVAVAACGTAFVYGATLGYGLYYDDYHFVRPWTRAELLRTWTGTWDPQGVESLFYRPLTAAWFALRFVLFGANTWALHLVTLTGHAACAVLLGWFVRREGAPRWVSLLGVALYAVHPALPYSQGVWLTNQMHLAESLLVIGGLIVWQSVRQRGRPAGVAGLVAIGVTAFLVKEDAVMFLPLLLGLTLLRRLVLGERPPRRFVAALAVAACAVPLGLAGLRALALGQLGGYGRPTAEQAWQNFSRGLNVLTGAPARRPWQSVTRWTATAALVAGPAIGLLARQRLAVYLTLAGVLTVVTFNLPFVFVSKAEQYHLLAIGAVLVLLGLFLACVRLVPRPAARRLAVAVCWAAVVPFALVARNIAADFSPCGALNLRAAGIVAGWWMVPQELKDALARAPAACRAGTRPPGPASLPIVTWGAYGNETDELGRTFRWTSGAVVVLVRPGEPRLMLAVRSPRAAPGHPVVVTLASRGTGQTLTLRSPDWAYATVRLAPGPLGWLRRMNRMDLTVRPVFVPRAVDPASQDARTLGVELRWVSAAGPPRTMSRD